MPQGDLPFSEVSWVTDACEYNIKNVTKKAYYLEINFFQILYSCVGKKKIKSNLSDNVAKNLW